MPTVGGALQAVLVAVFALSGVAKFIGGRRPIEEFRRMRYPDWFRKVTGAVEVAGAAGMLAGFWIPLAAAAAGAWMSATMLGALYTDFVRTWTPARGLLAALLLALALAVTALSLSSAA